MVIRKNNNKKREKCCILSEKKREKTSRNTMRHHGYPCKEIRRLILLLLSMPKHRIQTCKNSSTIPEVSAIAWGKNGLSGTTVIPRMKLVKKTRAYLCCLLVHFVCFVHTAHYWCILVYRYF